MMPEITVAMILEQAREVGAALLPLIAQIRADSWNTLWIESPPLLRIVIVLVLLVFTVQAIARWYRRLFRATR